MAPWWLRSNVDQEDDEPSVSVEEKSADAEDADSKQAGARNEKENQAEPNRVETEGRRAEAAKADKGETGETGISESGGGEEHGAEEHGAEEHGAEDASEGGDKSGSDSNEGSGTARRRRRRRRRSGSRAGTTTGDSGAGGSGAGGSGAGGSGGEKPSSAKEKPERLERQRSRSETSASETPAAERPRRERAETGARAEKTRHERQDEKPSETDRTRADRARMDMASGEKARADKARAERARFERPRAEKQWSTSSETGSHRDLHEENVVESVSSNVVYVPERSHPPADERKIAMFLDFENIALGVRDSETKSFDVALILERMLEKGKIVVKRAYADWERYSDFKRPLHEAAIELIDIPQKHYSGKNSADIKMVVDAIDLCYSKDHLDTFVLVTGDSDFSPLVSKLKENDKYVIGFGVKNSTSHLLIDNCDEFIYYEDVWRDSLRAPRLDHLPAKEAECFQLMVEAMLALFREGKDVIWGSQLKQTMKRKRPSFHEGYYGYSTFSELLEDAERKNIVRLRRERRSGGLVVAGFVPRGKR